MKALDFIFAARPLLHLPIWSVYLVTLAYHSRVTGESFSWFHSVSLAGLTLLFAGATYINQVYDEESDRINDKLGFIQRGDITSTQMWKGFAVGSVLPLAVAPLLSTATLLVFIQLLLLSYTYSAPPLRLKDRPTLGLLANAYSIGLLVSVAATASVGLGVIEQARWELPCYFFCSVGGTYALTTIADRAGDMATGKRTLAVCYGRVPTLGLAAALFAVAGGIAWAGGYLALFYLALSAFALAIAAMIQGSEPAVLLAAKVPILLLALLAGWHYPAYLVFVVALLAATRVYYRRRFGLTYPKLS